MTSDQPKRPKRPKRWRKYAYVCVAVFVLLGVLRWRFSGAPLARYVVAELDDRIRGTVQIESIDWPLVDAFKVITGGWLRVDVHGLVVIDEFENKVIETDGASAEIDVHAALAGTYRLRNVRLDKGGSATLIEVNEPYPAHEYDTTVLSLLSAFYPKKSPGFSTGYSAYRRTTVDIENFVVSGDGQENRGVSLTLDLGDVKINIEGVRGSGYLYYGGADPLGGKLYYSLSTNTAPPTQADSATITYATVNAAGETAYQVTSSVRDIEVHSLGQLPSRWPTELVPRDIQYKLSASGEDGMQVSLEGAMLDSWIDVFGGELRLDLKVEHAGALASDASDGLAGGKDLSLSLRMTGPVLAPKGMADLRNLELYIPMGTSLPTLQLQIDKAVAAWDTATDTGSMQEVVARVKDGVGRVEVEADFRVNPLHFDLDINIPEPLELATYVPEALITVAGGSKLSGTLSATGNENKQLLEELQLTFGEARISGLALREGNQISAKSPGLSIVLPGLSFTKIQGSLDPLANEISVDFDLALSKARRYLRLFATDLPMGGLHGHVTVGGALDDPTVIAPALVASGLPVLKQLTLDLKYAGNALVIRDAESNSLGGAVTGTGTILLGEAVRLHDLSATAIRLDLSKLPVIGAILTGRLDVRLEAEGLARRPKLIAEAKLSDWSIAGESYENTNWTLSMGRKGAKRFEGSLVRKSGGVLHLEALLDKANRLAGIISLRELPVDSLLAKWASMDTKMGGSLSTEMQLGGSVSAPTLTGQLTLLRSWVENAFIGTAELDIEPVGSSQVRITGHVLQRRISLDWLLTTHAPYESKLSLRVHRIELDRFFPELSEKHGMRGWVSGTIDFEGDLIGKRKPFLEAQLSEAELLIAREDEDGRPSPVRFRNKTPLALAFDGDVLRFTEEAIISGPTGDFAMSGQATTDALNFNLRGTVAVQLVQPFWESQFDAMDGQLRAEIGLVGSYQEPRVVGILELQDIYLKLAGQDSIITIPSGKIDFSNSQLSLTGLHILVADQFSDDISALHVSGGLALDNFAPDFWALRVEGQLAGKMLLAAAPEVFSAASGSANISVALLGEGATPDIDGTIEFGARNSLSLTPRDARREITLNAGILRFTDQLIELEGIAGTVDGEGQITELVGNISLEEWSPVDVDISVSTRDILFRIPQTLELAVHLKDFRVVGDAAGLEIEGHIEVADGRYIQKYNPVLDALQPTRSTSSESSIFENIPLLGNARLKVALVSRAFFVDNNLANIELNGELSIMGTPLRPRIDGVINVAQGSFKIPYSRARFTRTQGSVHFSPALEFPYQTPDVNIESESDYRSSDGQDHLVLMSLHGPLAKLQMDFRTSAGLNMEQTSQLILLGRTPDEVRRSLGETVTSRPGEFKSESTANADSDLLLLDQFAKDVASDYFANIIGDRLRKVTKLDVAKLQVGTGSIGFEWEKIVTRSWKFEGEIDRSLNGWNWDVSTDYRFNDQFSLGADILQTFYDDEVDDDKTEGRIRAQLRGYWIP